MSKTTRLPTLATFEALPVVKRAAVLVRWLAAQPPSQTYEDMDADICLLAQFGQALSRRADGIKGWVWHFTVDNCTIDVIPARYHNVVVPNGDAKPMADRTMGGALLRLQHLLKTQPIT